MVPEYQVFPAVLVLPVPQRRQVLLVLWVTLVCPVWTENTVARVLPVPQVHQVPAQRRETEATVGSQVFPGLQAGKESPEFLEAPVSLATPGSKEREGTLVSAEDLV